MEQQWVEFRIIPEHENYVITKKGQVYRNLGNSLRRIKTDLSTGYERVELDGKKIAVHRLVAEAFCEKKSPDQDKVFHIDGDVRNNTAENLCWGTPSEIQIWSHYSLNYRQLYFSP